MTLVLKQDLTTAIKDPLLDLTALNDVVEEDNSATQSNRVSNIAHQNMIRRYAQVFVRLQHKPNYHSI